MNTNHFILKALSTKELTNIANTATTEWLFLQTEAGEVEFLPQAEKRFIEIAEATGAAMVYSDYYQITEDGKNPITTIEYQRGSLRDDFNFGAVILLNTGILKKITTHTPEDYEFAGLYDIRLKISETSSIFRIAEPLYLLTPVSATEAESRHFAYIDKKNRNVQIDMEKACTAHLKRIGALLTGNPKSVNLESESFDCEASIIIPVRNRQKTIADAIHSALGQQTNFKFNVLVVDNFSTDDTGNIIDRIAHTYSNVFKITPDNDNLGIGGCWQLAINHSLCGKFAVQLDSDDIYQSPHTLQRIVDEFYRQRCAMLIGSYTITDFELNPIPPYLIDHAEWTDDNGRNNALRINGLGAPRAFFTPIIREIGFPNVSYGEDYAVGLRISREWKIGRIYDSVYLCRRWENNSDTGISLETLNRYNFYKDKIRTIELLSRIKQNI
ncbi:glycosyl transferase, group 2 family [Bacteroidetes oral taxon 274 str. F0058]|jgi:glycosyltransferase, group 2 family|nr:glycosyl transferase, group 2 family [Bacteroidetes oral taxon 274 str. F0058]